MIRAVLAWQLPSTYAALHLGGDIEQPLLMSKYDVIHKTLCYKEIQASSKIRVLPSELCSKLWT